METDSLALEKKLDLVKAKLDESGQAIADLQTQLLAQEAKLKQAFIEAMGHMQSSAIDLDKLDDFILTWTKRPYAIIPKKPGEWYLLVPKCFKLHFGWLEREEGAYNLFVVNRYYDLIQPVPAQLREALNLSRPFDGLTIQDGQLSIARPDKDPIAKVQKHYSRYVGKAIDEKTIQIKRGQEFALIAAVIRDGILPFPARPIAKADLLERHCSFKLRPYQARDFAKFLEYGAVGVFYPMGQGKTIFGLEAMCRLKGRKLVLVPSATLREQWLEHIKEHTTLDPKEYEVAIYHKNNVARLMLEEWVLVTYDEMHRLPANTYLQFAALRTKHQLFLTATPYREDGRIDLIFALARFPLGLDWSYFLENKLIVQPKITVYLEKDADHKRDRLDILLTDHKKTIIFCDSLEIGGRLSKRFNIPFVAGNTPPAERLQIIREKQQVLVSRVGDLGVSIKDLQRVIEYDFLFGSRTQELQRLGRLFHADFRGIHCVLMTIDEYLAYRKRLFSIYEKGFKVEIERGEGVPDDLSESIREKEPRAFRVRPAQERKVISRPLREEPILQPVFSGQTDFMLVIDERTLVTKELIIRILGSDYVKKHGGITQAEIIEVLIFNHLKYNPIAVRNLIARMFAAREIGGRTIGTKRVYFAEQIKGSDSGGNL